MTYVALLRGINVGGKHKVEMVKLKQAFERLGFKDVRTFINSGNVVFQAEGTDEAKLTKTIEAALEREFGFLIKVLVRSRDEIRQLVEALPASWVNDADMKCDVMFLWPELDSPEILKQIPFNPEVEDVRYFPGAVVWRVDRDQIRRGQVLRLVGTDVYKKLTIRNPNTVRKLYALMQSADN